MTEISHQLKLSLAEDRYREKYLTCLMKAIFGYCCLFPVIFTGVGSSPLTYSAQPMSLKRIHRYTQQSVSLI